MKINHSFEQLKLLIDKKLPRPRENWGEIVVTSFKEHSRGRGQHCIYKICTYESNKFPFFAVIFYNINQIVSTTESAYTATSKENDSKMYTREFDLEDEKHSSEGANTLDKAH